MITIRKAKLKDAEALASLFSEFMKYHDEIIIKKKPGFRVYLTKKQNVADIFRKYIRKRIRGKNSLVCLAEVDGEHAGYSVSFIKKTVPVFKMDRIGYISDLFVRKKFRGMGISSRFKDGAVRWFRKKGMKYISLCVYMDNRFAHSIYRKWGFSDYHIEMRRKI